MYMDDYPPIRYKKNFNDREPIEGKGCLIYIGFMLLVMIAAIVISIIDNLCN